jgi:FHA domain-containing protein
VAWTTKPPTVKDLLPEATRAREVFLRTHAEPVLLIVGYEDTGGKDASDRTVRLGEVSTGERRAINAAYVVAVKKQLSLGAEKILVGRGRENDVVLPFKSVSRLHAFFRLGTDGLWTLEDAGSAYGTFVRGTRLTSGHVRALGDDTPIRFGGVEANFHTAAGLFEFLQKLSKATIPSAPAG